jgi:hypothetical protein
LSAVIEMSRSSWTQGNFLGGEWGQQAQGRLDHPDYRKALAICQNAMPYEEGSVTRRPGKRMCGPTAGGQYAVTLTWDIAEINVYDLEISVNPNAGTSLLQVWQGEQPMVNNGAVITAVSTATPCVVTVPSAPNWSTGQQIIIAATNGTLSGTVQWAPILNRHLTVTKIDSTHFSLQDAITAANISGAGFAGLSVPTLTGATLVRFTLPYTTIGQLAILSGVQTHINGQNQFFLLCNGVPTYVITMTGGPSAGVWPTFTVAALHFLGPYENPGGLAGTIDTTTGTITLTATGVFLPNNGAGFAATDVGRCIRLHSQPPVFNPATAYTSGQAVLWRAVAYVATTNTTGQQPDQNPSVWTVNNQLLYWADGIIQSFIDGTHVTLTLGSPLLSYTPVIPTQNGLVINQFTLGLFNSTSNTYPGCGAFHDGRLWLSGSGIPNELDASETNALSFRPTDEFGNVLDTSAISYPLLSSSNNAPLWMHPDQNGLVIGTAAEEWLVFATANNLSLTPTNIQAHVQTKYGSYNHQPTRAGMAIIFVQRYAHMVFEYLADVFSQRFTGVPLNDMAKSVTGFMDRVAYVENFIPCIWARSTTNFLVGCTYRRLSRFVNSPPEFRGWHEHVMEGIAPQVTSISATQITQQNTGSIVDTLSLITSSGTTWFKEILAPVYDPNLGDQYAWHLDSGVSGLYSNSNQPTMMNGMVAVEDGTNMYFLGLWYQPNNARVFIAGIDFGTLSVVNGSITVAYGSDPQGIGTRAYLMTQLVANNPNGTVFVQGLGNSLPVLIGASYSSTVKLLRQDVQEQARTQAGTAVGESRRPYMASAFVAPAYNNSTIVTVDNLPGYPMVVRPYPNGPALANNIPFTGIWQDTVQADESFDGQLTILISGPQPFVLNNAGPFTETEER